MREIETELLTRILKNVQSVQNDNAPTVEIIVSRANTPILRPEYWQESIVTENATATCTSVAVKKTGRKITDVYVAYVAGGALTVKRAVFALPITRMVWETVETIEGAVECAIEFDGTFRRIERKVEFRTDDVPYLFYTTAAGALMYGLVGADTYDTLVASGVSNLDAVMGVESQYGEISQGLICFYVIAGAVYYRQLIDGVWQGQETVTIAPANAVSVKAERLFDYRVVLHVTDNTGALYEVFSKMEASGWISQDHISVSLTTLSRMVNIRYLTANDPDERITVSLITACRIRYAISPVMVYAENINNGEDDFGYKIRVTFDERVYDPDTEFILTDSATGSWGCTSAIKISDWIMELEFLNFNNAEGICQLSYTSGSLMGEVVPVEAGFVFFTPINLVPFAVDPPVVVSIENIEDWSGGV